MANRSFASNAPPRLKAYKLRNCNPKHGTDTGGKLYRLVICDSKLTPYWWYSITLKPVLIDVATTCSTCLSVIFRPAFDVAHAFACNALPVTTLLRMIAVPVHYFSRHTGPVVTYTAQPRSWR